MLKKSRIEALTDGVVAIVLTLMILEIKVPHFNEGIDWGTFILNIGIYAFSFVIIAIIWLNHHHLLTNVNQLSILQIWTNFFILFFLSLIPLPTKELGEDFYNPNSHFLYGLILGFCSFFYSMFHFLVDNAIKHIKKQEKKDLSIKNWATVVLYISAAFLSYMSVYISAAIFILIPLLYFIPSKKIISPYEN